jgi:hypothetical protein
MGTYRSNETISTATLRSVCLKFLPYGLLSVLLFVLLSSSMKYDEECMEAVITVNNHPSLSEVHPMVLLKTDSIIFTADHCNAQLRVCMFEVMVHGRTYRSYSNRITKEMRQAFVPLRRGEKVIFRNMKARDRQFPEIVRVLPDLTVFMNG